MYTSFHRSWLNNFALEARYSVEAKTSPHVMRETVKDDGWVIRTYPAFFLDRFPGEVEKLMRNMSMLTQIDLIQDCSPLKPLSYRLEMLMPNKSKPDSYWLAMCFKVVGVKFSWINNKCEMQFGLEKLMEHVGNLNDSGYMQGGLALDDVFYCTKSYKATCIDWGQFTKAAYPQSRFQCLSPAYFVGVDTVNFGASRRHMDTLAFMWMLAHLCNAYERNEKVLPPAVNYHRIGEEDERRQP